MSSACDDDHRNDTAIRLRSSLAGPATALTVSTPTAGCCSSKAVRMVVLQTSRPSSDVGDDSSQPSVVSELDGGRSSTTVSTAHTAAHTTDAAGDKLLLHNVGRAIQRTTSSLRRSRLIHVFYLLALPAYTLLGAAVFQALDGELDDRNARLHADRCLDVRDASLLDVNETCSAGGSFDMCYQRIVALAKDVDHCFRNWHAHHRELTHSMSDFVNAVIYAFSVYTTIGYGNMAPDTTLCRVATIVYAVFGIPLFFAFVKEEGIFLMKQFIRAWAAIKRRRHRRSLSSSSYSTRPHSAVVCPNGGADGAALIGCDETTTHDQPSGRLDRRGSACVVSNGSSGMTRDRKPHVGKPLRRRSRKPSSTSVNSAVFSAVREQHKVVLAAVACWIVFMLAASGVFSLSAGMTFFQSFYFLFNSVTLIGFGDEFPDDPRVVLFHCVFIVLGVVLFSMCYFILQEEIRHRAAVVSTHARRSISNYGHSRFVQSALRARKPWTRRGSGHHRSPSPRSHWADGRAVVLKRRQDQDASGARVAEFSDMAEDVSGHWLFERLRRRRQSAPVVVCRSMNFDVVNGDGGDDFERGASANFRRQAPQMDLLTLSPYGHRGVGRRNVREVSA